MSNINVKIMMTRDMPAPEYATDGSAAVDLRAAEALILEAGARAVVPTGVHIAPEGRDVVAIIAARSGLAIKHGITLSNAIGVIDSDYRGEVCVGLINLSDKPFSIERGDRIAQLMFMPVLHAEFIAAKTLDQTERGEGGFGSTGVK
jgi:dUTP pyrophosphatase